MFVDIVKFGNTGVHTVMSLLVTQ